MLDRAIEPFPAGRTLWRMAPGNRSRLLVGVMIVALGACQRGQIDEAISTTRETAPAAAVRKDITADAAETQVPEALAGIETLVFEAVNRERAAANVSRLSASVEMQTIARLHSHNMVAQAFFSHTDQANRSPFDRMRAYYPDLRWCAAGENIAYNYGDSPARVAENLMTAWLRSPGHRANMLNPRFRYMGVGVVEADGAYYATQNFYAGCD
ncbi:MAG: CAP domain-containing protein [Spirochaetales bacterium]|nr:CAP domain-containing protein [Leptospiraceae bacterium]MCP5482319.1 CAP domain-containing protein [Spirochaetales bacterium]MCP5484242.1 CAP domain-containing protein [Spirochaetales bacterium]